MGFMKLKNALGNSEGSSQLRQLHPDHPEPFLTGCTWPGLQHLASNITTQILCNIWMVVNSLVLPCNGPFCLTFRMSRRKRRLLTKSTLCRKPRKSARCLLQTCPPLSESYSMSVTASACPPAPYCDSHSCRERERGL